MPDPDDEPTPEMGTDAADAGDLPRERVAEAERLTRLARAAEDDAEAAACRERRDAVLAEHGFRAREREEDAGATLICYPEEWVVDGTVRVDRVEDVDRAIEVSIEGTGDPDDWEAVAAHNRAVADRVREKHGPVHGANASAFATFMSNHYAKPVEEAADAEREEFRTEYFPRNAWPTDEQRAAVERSLSLVVECARNIRTGSRTDP